MDKRRAAPPIGGQSVSQWSRTWPPERVRRPQPLRYNRPRVVIARHFLIGGRVQGVGFRFFTEDAAAREGLHGWARNLPDGRVEAYVEGDRDAVERFERAIRRGPSGARVEAVEVVAAAPSGHASGFSIRF